jgi:hypothetical protein
MGDARSVLLLCQHRPHHAGSVLAGNVLQHIDALLTRSRHGVYPFDPIDRADAAAALDLDEFDAVLIHYTIMVAADRYLVPALAEKIARFEGLKIQLIQDEYRSVDAVCAKIRELGIDVLYTCVPSPDRERIYETRLPGVELVTTLAGYVADELVGLPSPPLEQRPVDVGYRGRDVPYWLGRLGREKVEIGERFLAHAEGTDLRCDISSREEDRIYGDDWLRFLSSCRATLGTESGASIVDFDGSIQREVNDHLARDPGASFDEVAAAELAETDGALVIHVASPRLFEAAALRTAMILFPGVYSGIVEPWKHYVPVEKDFSNFGDVVEAIRDVTMLQGLTERAYSDLIGSGRYSLRAFVSELDDLIEARSTSSAPGDKSAYTRARRRLALPSVRGPSRLRAAAGRMLTLPVGVFAVARDPVARGLATSGLRRPEVRRAGLFGDVVRFAALRRGVAGGAFAVQPELDRERRMLLLRSIAPDANNAGPADTANVDELGEPATIVWNHSPVGVSAGLLGQDLLPVRVGRHGLEGAHSFRALAILGHDDPVVRDALRSVLRGQENRS